MTIWVDADACPAVVKTVLCRAAERTQTDCVFVANQPITLPGSRYLRSLRVAAGFDVADNEIVKRVMTGDLVVTGDIPLADEVITKGAEVINNRGESLTHDNIKARLNIRDFMDSMRASGIQSGGPKPYNDKDKQAFANALDRYLARRARA